MAGRGHQRGRGAPDSVLVDVGWPAELAGAAASLPLVRTRGMAPGLLAAAALVLAGE